jgi:hypothetical protein
MLQKTRRMVYSLADKTASGKRLSGRGNREANFVRVAAVSAVSEGHADAPGFLPDDPASFLHPAVVQDEPVRNGAAAVHFDAGAAGADVDDAARVGYAFAIGKNGPGLGYQPGGPDTMEAPVIFHVISTGRLTARTLAQCSRMETNACGPRGRFAEIF